MGAACSGLKPHQRDKTHPLGPEPDPPISRDASTTQPPDHVLPKINLEDVRCRDSPRPSDIGTKLLLRSKSEPIPPKFAHCNGLKMEPMVQNHSKDAPPPLPGNIHNENKRVRLQDAPSPLTKQQLHLQDTPSTSANQLVRSQDTPSPSTKQQVRLQDAPSPSTNQQLHLQDTPSTSANQLALLQDTPSPLTYLYKHSALQFTVNERTPSPLTYVYDQRRRQPLLLKSLNRQLTPLPSTYLYDIVNSAPEQEIRKLSSWLLHLKDEVENLCAKTCAEYMAFLRSSEERELNDLRKHISTQVQELLSGTCRKLDELKDFSAICESRDSEKLLQNGEEEACKVEAALEDLDNEEKNHLVIKGSIDSLFPESLSYKSNKDRRKFSMLSKPRTGHFEHEQPEPSSYKSIEDQHNEFIKQHYINGLPLDKILSEWSKLGEGHLEHELLLRLRGFHLPKNINNLLRLCFSDPEIFLPILYDLVFPPILLIVKDSDSMFVDNLANKSVVLLWAEMEIRSFVSLVQKHAPPFDTVSGLRTASIFTEASLRHCSSLEPLGQNLSKWLLVQITQYIELGLSRNFIRARSVILDFEYIGKSFSIAASSDSYSLNINSGMMFISTVKDIVDQLTPSVILHLGQNVLTEISQLFDEYVDALIRAMTKWRGNDFEQLGLLRTAFTVAEEHLPIVVSTIWMTLSERDGVDPIPCATPSNTMGINEWRQQLQKSYIKLTDHFCRQYMWCFIYYGEGKARLDAQIYLACGGDQDLLRWWCDPMPSLPFQALFGKLRQLSSVAGDVLLGKEKMQKILLARLITTLLMWLSTGDEFWGALANRFTPLRALGLQQLIMDMHFTVEIARFGGFLSKSIHQIASDIIARAISTFSASGMDPQSILPEDEWFVEKAKTALNKLLGAKIFICDSSDDGEHITMNDDGHI